MKDIESILTFWFRVWSHSFQIRLEIHVLWLDLHPVFREFQRPRQPRQPRHPNAGDSNVCWALPALPHSAFRSLAQPRAPGGPGPLGPLPQAHGTGSVTTAHAASILALAAVWPINIATRQAGMGKDKQQPCPTWIGGYELYGLCIALTLALFNGFSLEPIVLSVYTVPVVGGVWRIGSLRRHLLAFFSLVNFAGEFWLGQMVSMMILWSMIESRAATLLHVNFKTTAEQPAPRSQTCNVICIETTRAREREPLQGKPVEKRGRPW